MDFDQNNNNHNQRDRDFAEAYNNYPKYPTNRSLAEEFGINERTVRRWAAQLRADGVDLIDRSAISGDMQRDMFDDEIVAQNVTLAKQKQKFQDTNRIERKAFREAARIENAVGAYYESIKEVLEGHSFKSQTFFHNEPSDAVGIVHMSDQHFNELVELEHNRYDWEIASKRLKKYVDQVKRLSVAYGVKKLFVAMTGDILNSDRRLDELLGNAGNRAKASVLAVDLLRQSLLDLNQDCDLWVTTVSGNESRITKDVGWTNEVASDNYDFAVAEMLRLMLESEGIQFIQPHTPLETVVNVNGQNVLVIHGHSFRKSVETDIQRCKSKYVSRGIQIDFVIFGHVHNALIADGFARSSSLVGDNEYSSQAGHYEGRASQNFYVVHSSGGFDGIKIDLQDVQGIKGYDLSERLMTYKTKSVGENDRLIRVPDIII